MLSTVWLRMSHCKSDKLNIAISLSMSNMNSVITPGYLLGLESWSEIEYLKIEVMILNRLQLAASSWGLAGYLNRSKVKPMDLAARKPDGWTVTTTTEVCYGFSFSSSFPLWIYYFTIYIWVSCHMVAHVTHFNSSYLWLILSQTLFHF